MIEGGQEGEEKKMMETNVRVTLHDALLENVEASRAYKMNAAQYEVVIGVSRQALSAVLREC